MKKWFDETTGLLTLDSHVVKSESYQKIMEDGIVSDSEVHSHTKKVEALLKELDKELTGSTHEKVFDLLCEISVLYTIQRIYEQQNAERQ